MMIGGAALLLMSAAVGYLVLERADKQKGSLKSTGQILGWVIIAASALGVACLFGCMSGTCPMGGRGKYHSGWKMKNSMGAPSSAPAFPDPSAMQ